LINILLDPIT